ncbi:MAG: alkaline phosphatase D family protein [Verrucomicrobia bacterium]|nr:alkaline phosphatase D family protein [Verrucomicrobiota bacterium]
MPPSSPLGRRSFLQHSAALTATALLAPPLGALLRAEAAAPSFRSAWDRAPDRTWLGAEYWANPLQDWRLSGGRIECLQAAYDRNVHLLTRQVGRSSGSLDLRVHVGRMGGGPLAGRGSAGFRLGIVGTLKDHPEWQDYRNNLWAQPSAGLNAGLSAEGSLFIGHSRAPSAVPIDLARDVLELRLSVVLSGRSATATLSAHDVTTGRELARTQVDDLDGGALLGNLALACNFPDGGAVNAKGKAKKAKSAAAPPGGTAPNLGQFWFADWRVAGSVLTGSDEQVFGPILWTQYTLSGGTLKLSAQMPPLGAGDNDVARLELRDGPGWRLVGEAKIDPVARLALFRLDRWDATRDIPYRVAYTLRQRDGTGTEHHWAGVIRRDPVDQEVLTVADVSCNIHAVFPNVPLVRNAAKLNPDLLAFVGDQFYESTAGYGVQRTPLEAAMLDYLRKWYFHGWTWRELMRDRPSISIPDDHDVYQGNLFGEGGEAQKSTQEAGGYAMPVEWVNMVHRTQTAHHPDPYDPAPARRGTLNYYGPLTYGRVSFAILADRQFKSGPEGKVPSTGGRGDHVKDPDFDPRTADVPGVDLLGSKQEKFLEEWAADWRGADLKAVLSQTVFTSMATTHGGGQEVLIADYDSSGWPQSPRDRALRAMRRAFAVHIAGDQHLPAVVQYGIETHRDAPVAFAGPAVNVGYPRWWEPTKTGRNKATGNTRLTGNFLDHFGHPLTVLAVHNGEPVLPRGSLEAVQAKASGLGLVRLNKPKRTITFECWPYLADVSRPDTQFPGWPVTVRQIDNYARRPVAQLPMIQVSGIAHPVLLVFAESNGEFVYGLRLAGGSFQPPVFAPGRYTLKVGDPDSGQMRTVPGLEAAPGNQATVDVRF